MTCQIVESEGADSRGLSNTSVFLPSNTSESRSVYLLFSSELSRRRSGPTSSPSLALAFPFSSNTFSSPAPLRKYNSGNFASNVGLGPGVGGRLIISTLFSPGGTRRPALGGGVDGAGVGKGAGTFRIFNGAPTFADVAFDVDVDVDVDVDPEADLDEDWSADEVGSDDLRRE